MTRASVQRWAWNFCRISLGFLFLMAATGKFRDPVKFMGGIAAYDLVHGWTVPLGAVFLPGIELLAALALLLDLQLKAGALVMSGQLLLFIAAMASALWRKLDLDCSCFDLAGADPSLMAYGPLMRDLMLTGLALAFQVLTDPAWKGAARRWSSGLAGALFLWIAFGLLGPGQASWASAARLLLAAALLLWLVWGLGSAIRDKLDWSGLLLPLLPSGALLWLILHLLGDGAATLGWGTIIRDVLMLLPALGLVFYRPTAAR